MIPAQKLLVQSEKMRIVAELSAGMAYDINNPLCIIMLKVENVINSLMDNNPANITAAESAGIELDKIRKCISAKEIDGNLSSIMDVCSRAARIVDNMLQFSRGGESKFDFLNLNNTIEKTLTLAVNYYDLGENYDFKKTLRKTMGLCPVFNILNQR